MASAAPSKSPNTDLSGTGPLVSRPAPQRRKPIWLDYLLFFFAIPIAMGIIFSLVGTRLTNGMPYLDSLIYMILHMLVAWIPVSLSAYLVKYSFRNWQPPVIAICLIGLLLAIMPTAFLFQMLGELYASLYPVFAANRADDALPNWNLQYLLHFVRYSIPIVPLFLAGVYGYRFVMGVDWFGYARRDKPAHDESTDTEIPSVNDHVAATAALIEGTKLPRDAVLLAIRAEQHYIQIWSDQGNDLVRFRFRDLADTLANCNGAQVHRSWWVNIEKVHSCKQSGRKLELVINDELSVPVSLSYKNAVLPLIS
jgi:hypothetical protein